MTDKTQVCQTPQLTTNATPAEQTARAQEARLRDIVVQIRSDSQRQSRQYLDESHVPHGGE